VRIANSFFQRLENKHRQTHNAESLENQAAKRFAAANLKAKLCPKSKEAGTSDAALPPG
jgi:hypothetical protein